MADKKTKKAPKKRATKYDDYLKFDGTFEDMIGISVKDAEKKVAKKKAEKKEE